MTYNSHRGVYVKLTLFHLKLAILLILLPFAALFTACGRNDNIGGRLPMVVTQWEDDTDGDILRWFTYGGYADAPKLNFGEGLSDIARIGDDFPVPRAMAAKMLALAATGADTIDSWARYPSIEFADVAVGSWYFRYINAVYTLGQMSGHGTAFRPHDMLTLYEAGLLMAALNPQGPGLLVGDDNRDLPISYALWVDLFIQYLADVDASIESVQVIPLAYDSASEQVRTNVGLFSAIGINMGLYLDREIKVLHRDREIVALVGQVSAEPVLRNVFVKSGDRFGVTVLVGGVTRHFVYNEGVAPLPEDAVIADIQISGANILAAFQADRVIRGTIEEVGAGRIVLREWGVLPLRSYFSVYSDIDNLARTPADLIVGADMADFYLLNGAIGAAVITDLASPVYIRVVIGTCNFAGLVHNELSITATGSFIVGGVESPDSEQVLAGAEVFNVTSSDLEYGSRLYIQPKDPNDRLQIVGLGRHSPDPLYRGRFEIARANGGLVIVNELPLEEYLFAVVPSEMPSFFGLEAAKVQAITARTFAIHQFYENRFRAFGAHVDDSVISQVYNNIPENEISREAVRATQGLVLTYDGEIILANFYSTSSGVTANFGEVWAAGSSFPAHTPPHLTSRLQFNIDDINDRAMGNAVSDLSREENAALFFRSTDIPAFESSLPWFRWQVRMTAEELSGSINTSLQSRQQANPAMIHALDASGAATGRVATSIGRLTDMEITRRGQGGNVMEVILSGTEGRVRVQTEFNIRTLLAPRTATVSRVNGSDVSNMSLMPSGFFTFEKETDTAGNLVAITFFGGGHGHGVGMSQNGANVLLNAGYSFYDVLKHYYPGVEIVRLE